MLLEGFKEENQGWIQRFWKERALCVGHHSWPTKKILGFRWSKNANVRNYSFWRNISFSIFKFCPFLNIMKACRWNQSFKIYKRFYKKREETRNSHTSVNEKRRNKKSWNFFYLTGYFMKPLKMAINHFFFNRSFCSQDFFYFANSFTGQFLFFDVRMTQEISKGEISTF